MKGPTILHTADLHYCPEHRAEALASLRVVLETVRERRVDLVAFSGDFFDRGIQASDRDGMTELLDIMRQILELVDVVAVSGTPTHDVPGAYAVLTHIKADHEFTLLQPGEKAFLHESGWVTGDCGEENWMLLLGCPEPGKEWLLANRNGLSGTEATQAVVDGMKALLLGLGGLRREHPDLPAVFLYHGQVRGATMGAGQVVPGSALAIGAEDLALVGADYYALGDIHLAQQIGDLPAYYPGSAYPCDWGERDQKGCNLVTFPDMYTGNRDPNAVRVERIDFPRPPRLKVTAPWGADIAPLGVAGFQTWAVVTSDEALNGNREEHERIILGHLLANGALPGSRVTIEVKPTETVRAAEIADAARLQDKLRIYRDASEGNAIPSRAVYEKADALEAEARTSGAVGAGAHIRIQRLRLRGAVGVWKGLGVDEIALDLDAYEHGLIALVGENGAGKTTLIENLHPYPELLTRGGTLQSHFRLKDSCRELVFTDDVTLTRYRALILIDATLATPKAEYHLYRRDQISLRNGGEYEWVPLANGRKEDYLRAITELWGSLDLFLRSAFVSQKPPHGHPDLADATPAERKSLFRELGGLDYLQAYAEAAKARADAAEKGIATDQARADQMATEIAATPGLESRAARLGAELAPAQVEVQAVTDKGKWQAAIVADLEKQAAEQRSLSDRRRALADEGARLTSDAINIDRAKETAEKALTGRAAAAEIVQRASDLERARGELHEAKSKVSAVRERLSAEHARAVAAHGKAREELQAQQRAHERKAESAKGGKAVLLEKIDRIAEGLAEPLTDACPTCGQTLPEAKLAGLKAFRAADQKRLAELQEQVLLVDAEVIDAEQAAQTVAKRLSALPAPEAPKLPVFEQQPALDAVVLELSRLNAAQAAETVRQADAAAEQIRAGTERREQIRERQIAIEDERARLMAQIDETIPAKYAEARVCHEQLQRAYAEARARAAGLEAEAKAVAVQIDALKVKATEYAALDERLTAARSELADWRYLERACGRDGIQALELDAMGPGIADTANSLLDAAYGSRFRVEIRTTRIAGKGSRTKQVEDFEIIIRDTERGTEQPLDTLSGGETVWIRKALYAAFGIIRARNTGTRFLTCMFDEADGALDPDSKRRYVAMLQAEHAASGRAHTIVISHDEAVQQAIGQRVEMAELAREPVGVGA